MMMMKQVLLAVVVLNYVIVVSHGHGWMLDPVPRSGGGAGSGNASTQGPCGKTGSSSGPNSPSAEWLTGDSVTVQYKRANNHGVTGQTVTFTMSLTAGAKTNPSTADFNNNNGVIVADNVVMDTTVSGAQQTSFVVPDFNLTADAVAVVQFHWTPTSGGNWYDCAWVQIRAPPANNPCNTNNGGCHGNATCTPDITGGDRTCACRIGFFGDGLTCEPAPLPIGIQLLVDGIGVSQDVFTANVARILSIPPSRVLFDRTEERRSSGQTMVFFEITADDAGQSAEPEVLEFRNLFLTDDEKLNMLGHDLVEIQVENDPRVYTYVEGGQPIPGNEASPSKSGTSSGAIAGIVIGVIIGVAVLVGLVVGAVIFMKRRSGGSSLPAYYATKDTVQAEQAYGGAPTPPPTSTYSSPAPKPSPYAAPKPSPYAAPKPYAAAPAPAPKPSGGRQWDRSGQTYNRS